MPDRTRLLAALWATIAVIAVGVVWDLRWHAEHGSAAGASDLVEGHGLVWIGIAATTVVAVVGTRLVPSRWYVGHRLLLIVTLLYAVIEAGHVWAHHAMLDTTVAHLLMAVGKVAIVVAAISATVDTSRRLREGDDPLTGSATSGGNISDR